MRRSVFRAGVAAGLLLCACELCGQELKITSFDPSGRIIWSCPSLNVTCRVEQASSLDGSWSNLPSIYVTHPSNETAVAMTEAMMFYRVVCVMPDSHFPDITAEQSLALIVNREEDPNFTVIDVRTAPEYAGRHIIGALNIDYKSDTFESDLDALDKNGVYLVHCESGDRSGTMLDNAHDTMLGLGLQHAGRHDGISRCARSRRLS